MAAVTFTSSSTTATTNKPPPFQSHTNLHARTIALSRTTSTISSTVNMSAQPDNNQMEGVQDPATENKGKGKAAEGEAMQESMDEDSSDESGVEDQVRSPYAA